MANEVLLAPLSIGRVYLVKGSDGYLMIDTGLSTNYAQLRRFLKKSHISTDQIRLVVITHADGDHFGGLCRLLQDCPALVSAASEIEAESIREGVSSRPLRAKGLRKALFSLIGPLFAAKPARITRILTPGEVLPWLGGLEVLDTRGHTPGHLSFWSKSTGVLFCGDSINIDGDRLSPSTGANTWDAELAQKSFDMQMDLHPQRIYAGHGLWKRLHRT